MFSWGLVQDILYLWQLYVTPFHSHTMFDLQDYVDHPTYLKMDFSH